MNELIDRLHLLADWFDVYDSKTITISNEVQEDLRKYAYALERIRHNLTPDILGYIDRELAK